MRGFLALLALSTTAAAQQLDYHTFTPSTGIPETYVVAHAGDGALGPLIVMLHGFGGDHDEVVDLNTDAITCNDWNFLAQATNWSQGPDDYYVLMVDGGQDHDGLSHNTYGREQFQVTLEETLDEVFLHYNVDPDRVYGFGFSLGGGQALSFAARHRDPTSNTMFAAVVNHTGATSIPYEYFYVAAPAGQAWLEDLYGLPAGETYCTMPFPFRRANALDVYPCCGGGFCPTTGQVHAPTSIAQNLRSLPILSYYNVNDSNQSLVYQNQMLDAFMASNPSYITVQSAPNSCGQYHQWNVVPAWQALLFFDMHTRAVPPNGFMLAADDERYFDFTILRHDADDLALIGWNVDVGGNELILNDVENVRSLTLHTDDTGLDPGSLLTVELTIDADVPTVILLEDYATPPSLVCRDGSCGTPDWSGGVVRLVELQTGTHEWVIIP